MSLQSDIDVRVVEVGPRDGLQNEAVSIPTDVKIRFIAALADAGVRQIEATSFVSPKWVPQLADARELWPLLPKGPLYSALVPNLKGLEAASELGVRRIAVFTAASESFAKANVNRTITETLEQFATLIQAFRRDNPGSTWVRGYVSTAFQCPYEGAVPTEKVVEVCRALLNLGVDELSIGDTIGVAVPSEVRILGRALLDSLGKSTLPKIAWHFHDTWGTGLANVTAALDMGFRSFDSSAAGLGGCPYAPGAGGNLASEDLMYLLHREGLRTGVDLDLLAAASAEVLALLERQPTSKAQLAALARASVE